MENFFFCAVCQINYFTDSIFITAYTFTYCNRVETDERPSEMTHPRNAFTNDIPSRKIKYH